MIDLNELPNHEVRQFWHSNIAKIHLHEIDNKAIVSLELDNKYEDFLRYAIQEALDYKPIRPNGSIREMETFSLQVREVQVNLIKQSTEEYYKEIFPLD